MDARVFTAEGAASVQKINYPKEQMHRIQYTKLTQPQIGQKLTQAAITGPTSATPCRTHSPAGL